MIVNAYVSAVYRGSGSAACASLLSLPTSNIVEMQTGVLLAALLYLCCWRTLKGMDCDKLSTG